MNPLQAGTLYWVSESENAFVNVHNVFGMPTGPTCVPPEKCFVSHKKNIATGRLLGPEEFFFGTFFSGS